ncbi:MAG: acyl carrier protein [Roseburia sp.]|nr:acyl carrier protein [Roseburia sp.]
MDDNKKLEMLAEVLDMEASDLDMEMELDTIGEWDSMAYLNFIVLLDDEFGKKVESGVLKGCKKVSDLINLMN